MPYHQFCQGMGCLPCLQPGMPHAALLLGPGIPFRHKDQIPGSASTVISNMPREGSCRLTSQLIVDSRRGVDGVDIYIRSFCESLIGRCDGMQVQETLPAAGGKFFG